jgi:hypothetical protein
MTALAAFGYGCLGAFLLNIVRLAELAELSPRTFCTFPRELSSLRRSVSPR